MKPIALPILLAAWTATATPAPTPAPARTDRDRAALDQRLAGHVPGAAQRCLDRIHMNDIETHRDTILYKEGRTIWVNRVAGNCAGLAQGDRVVTQSLTPGQSCAGDIVRTQATTGGALTGSCVFGEFVPYRRAR